MCERGTDGGTVRWQSDPPIEMDYSPTSGSVDGLDARKDIDAETITGRHGYTSNQTYAKRELPAVNDAGVSLNQLNRGVRLAAERDDDGRDNDRRQRKRVYDRQGELTAWAAHIGLTPRERQRTVEILGRFPPAMTRRHSMESAMLAALTLAANEIHGDNRRTQKSIRERGPDTDCDDLVERYERLRSALNVDADAVSTLRKWYHRNA
jgi:hypothetical protein